MTTKKEERMNYEFTKCRYCGNKHTYLIPVSLYYSWNCDMCKKYNELIPSKKFLQKKRKQI